MGKQLTRADLARIQADIDAANFVLDWKDRPDDFQEPPLRSTLEHHRTKLEAAVAELEAAGARA